MFTVSDLLIKGTFSLALTLVVNVLSPASPVNVPTARRKSLSFAALVD